MLEGLIPSLKHALLLIVIGGAFFAFTNNAFAQGLGGTAGFEQRNGTGGGTFVNTGNNPGNPSAAGYSTPTYGTPSGVSTNNSSNPGNNNGTGESGSGTGDSTVTQSNPPPSEPPVQLVEACDGFFNTINCFVVNFFGSFVAIAGYAFDVTIRWFIVGFGELYKSTGLGSTVEATWTTVRDVFNLTFIFGLVYIGFQIILGVNDSSAKRTIPLLIIAALFVNFSMFIVKFIIDFANIAALQIYNLFQLSEATQSTTTKISESSSVAAILAENGPSISLAFINALGVTTLLGYLPATEQFLYLFGLIIIFGVLIYVFLAGAIMVTIRFAVLIFYIIFSPVMFLGWVFPGLQSYTSSFWKGLIGQAFFAPAFIFMLYISLSLITGFNDASIGGHIRNEVSSIGSGSALESGDALHTSSALVKNMASIIPFLILTVVFILASLVVAKRVASASGSMVVNMTDKALKGLKVGTAGVLAGGAGYGAYKGIDKMTNSENRLARGIGRTLTYAGARDKAEKAYKGSIQGQWKENRKKQSSELAVRKSQSKLSSIIGKLPKSTEEQIAFEQAITDASTSQIIKELDKYAPESESYQRIVRALSPNQVNKIFEAKDDEFSPSKKASFGKVRSDMVKKRLTSKPIGSENDPNAKAPDIQLAIERDASADDLKHLGLRTLRDNAAHITASKMDDLKSKLSPTEWGILNNERKAKLQEAFEKNPKSVFYTYDSKPKKDKDIAKLPGKILTDPEAAKYLNSNVLNNILMDDAMNASEREIIVENIYALGSGHPVSVNVHEWLTKTPAGKSFVTNT